MINMKDDNWVQDQAKDQLEDAKLSLKSLKRAREIVQNDAIAMGLDIQIKSLESEIAFLEGIKS